MPIYNTYTFWNYLTNEPSSIIDNAIDLLTKKFYNFDTKQYNIHVYYSEVSKITIDNITYRTIKFPAGLTNYLQENLNLYVENKENPYPKYTRKDILTIAEDVKQINPKYEVRDYQIDAVLSSLDKFSSLITASTGSGKTSIMSLLCKILLTDNILILNDNNFILQQIYERLLSFGIEDISWNPSKEPDYTKKIVLLNTKSSDSRLNTHNEVYINYLQTVNTIIWDEAHGIQALTAFEPIFYTNIDNLKHLIGYTATPFRNYKHPYADSQDFRTIAILGEPSFIYSMKNSIEDENIAQPYVYFIRYPNKIPYLPEQFKDNYYMQYRMSITYNKARNKAGLEMIRFLNNYGIKTMVSINNIKPGQNLLKTLKESNIESLFICGGETIYKYEYNTKGKLVLKTESGNVQTVKDALNNGINIIISSKVFDAGVDIDIFQAVILFSAGKTPIAGLQRVGRASRKKYNSMNVALAIDFKDEGGIPVFQSHYVQRRNLMVDSGVKVLNDVHDFIKLVQHIADSKK